VKHGLAVIAVCLSGCVLLPFQACAAPLPPKISHSVATTASTGSAAPTVGMDAKAAIRAGERVAAWADTAGNPSRDTFSGTFPSHVP